MLVIGRYGRKSLEKRHVRYAALRSVRQRTLTMEAWLDYFLSGVVEEYERVATSVTDSRRSPGPGGALQLTTGQERALATLRLRGRREFMRREYEDAGRVSRSTAGEDLRALVRHGVLVTRGSGPSIRYVFPGARERASGVGRPRKWTDEVIEAQLREFLDGRAEWPTPREFRDAGRAPRYAAATRAGGIARWRALVGM